ncbi:hypothetical protein MOMA_02565 [Moraxella macacae 0408225]|uniref:Uncharacterized protein n=1 Tax=Moraxella macacae 0408225 TaxID=1230338 RepID=L2F886_9GAMM|nr:hypothetical protein [Moraxella macacae]ELA09252.1 hypothetical protein MOMA_02565 [Moraxella macacae 0408225]
MTSVGWFKNKINYFNIAKNLGYFCFSINRLCMVWTIIFFGVIGFFYWVHATSSERDAKKALDIIGNSHELIQEHFPYNVRYRSAWMDIICVEAAYLTLIVFIHGLTIDGDGSRQKQEMVQIIINTWSKFILKVSTLPDTPQNMSLVRKKLTQRGLTYIPLIDKYFEQIAYNDALKNSENKLTYENYELYEKFMKFSLENYEEIKSNEHSYLAFHRNKGDDYYYGDIWKSIAEEAGNAALKTHDDCDFLFKENGLGLKIDERAKFIRHHIIFTLFVCYNFKQDRHIS